MNSDLSTQITVMFKALDNKSAAAAFPEPRTLANLLKLRCSPFTADIVAAKTPDKILRRPVDPRYGLQLYEAMQLAAMYPGGHTLLVDYDDFCRTDRFGKFPEPVENLFLLGEIKLAAGKAGISRVEVRERKMMLTRNGEFILVEGKFPRLVATPPHLSEVLELTRKFT